MDLKPIRPIFNTLILPRGDLKPRGSSGLQLHPVSQTLPQPHLSAIRIAVHKKLDEIKKLVREKAQTSGLHLVLYEYVSFDLIAHKIQHFNKDQLEIIDQTVSNITEQGAARRAFVLKSYTEFFYQASVGEIRLLDKGEIQKLFGREKPVYVTTVGVKQEETEEQTYFVLFKNGNLMRSRKGIEKIEIRKGNWRANFLELTPEELLTNFFDQLIHDQSLTRDENCIYIKIPKTRIKELKSGILSRRIWFSLLYRYPNNFNNQAWANNGSEPILLKVQLEEKRYADILKMFIQKIHNKQIEGLNKLGNDKKFIAKLEKSAPNFAIEDLNLLGNFKIQDQNDPPASE